MAETTIIVQHPEPAPAPDPIPEPAEQPGDGEPGNGEPGDDGEEEEEPASWQKQLNENMSGLRQEVKAGLDQWSQQQSQHFQELAEKITAPIVEGHNRLIEAITQSQPKPSAGDQQPSEAEEPKPSEAPAADPTEAKPGEPATPPQEKPRAKRHAI